MASEAPEQPPGKQEHTYSPVDPLAVFSFVLALITPFSFAAFYVVMFLGLVPMTWRDSVVTGFKVLSCSSPPAALCGGLAYWRRPTKHALYASRLGAVGTALWLLALLAK